MPKESSDTLELLLSRSIDSMERVAASQSEIASAVHHNTNALEGNTKEIAQVARMIQTSIDKTNSILETHTAYLEKVDKMPENFELVLREGLKTVPGSWWSWVWLKIQEVGGGLAGIGLIAALIYGLIAFFL